MSNVLIEEQTMNNIADAIRNKLSSTDTYLPEEMPDAIESIEGGGGQSSPIKSLSFNDDYSAEIITTDDKPLSLATTFNGDNISKINVDGKIVNVEYTNGILTKVGNIDISGVDLLEMFNKGGGIVKNGFNAYTYSTSKSKTTLVSNMDITQDRRFELTDNGYTWYYSNDAMYSGLNTYRSYKITHSQTTIQTITNITSTPITLMCFYKVSSEGGCDKFTISANGNVLVNEISGEVGWAAITIEVQPNNNITLTYRKDGSVDRGLDLGAIIFYEEV